MPDWILPDPSADFDADDHDPAHEPYANMTRAKLIEMMAQTDDPAEQQRINEFIMDRMTSQELKVHNHGMRLAVSLIEEYDANGNDQCLYLTHLAIHLAEAIDRDLPPAESGQDDPEPTEG